MKKRIFITTIIIVCTVVLTSLSIDAADTLRGRSGTLLSNLISAEKGGCPSGSVLLTVLDKRLCVDIYEASPSVDCTLQIISSSLDTRTDSNDVSCKPQSSAGAMPWIFVTYQQANELCAKAGKRLPTSEEWYTFSVGTPDTDVCNTAHGSLEPTDASDACHNSFGIHDAIGNAWEWVSGVVQNGVYKGHAVPESGYVDATDLFGLPTETKSKQNDNFHDDYFWSDKSGEYGILRGGFYGSGKDGGLYGVQAKTALSFSSGAIGFRCVKDIQ